MSSLNVQISDEILGSYSRPNYKNFDEECIGETIGCDLDNALCSSITYMNRTAVLGSKSSTRSSYNYPRSGRLQKSDFSVSRSNKMKTIIEAQDFAAAKQFVLCKERSSDGNLNCTVAINVMLKGIHANQMILLVQLAFSALYFIVIRTSYLYLTFERHTSSHHVPLCCTTLGKYEFVGTEKKHFIEQSDADGDDHKTNRSGSKCLADEDQSCGSGSSGGDTMGGDGADGGSAAGGDDGDDERGSRKKFGGPQSEDQMEAAGEEDAEEGEELEDEEESDPNKKMIGGCGKFGNYMRRKLEEEQEKEEAERHRQAMIAHYEAWERSNAAARAYVRKHIAKVEPEAPSDLASGSNMVYDEDHPAFSMAFAVPVPTPGTRFQTRSEPVASGSRAVGNEEQAASYVATTGSKMEEEEDPEAERAWAESPEIPPEAAPSRSPSPPRYATFD